MAILPETPVRELGKLGARCAPALKGLGVLTAGDLLRHYPFRYEDLSRTVPLDGPSDGPVTVRVRVDMIRTRRAASRKMLLTEATVSDEAGQAKVVWFRQPFIAKVLHPGDQVRLSGRIEAKPWGLEIVSPAYERETDAPGIHTGRLVPVYPLTGTLTVKQLRALLHMALPAVDLMPETLDGSLRARHGLPGIADALRAIHFPDRMEEAEAADRRFRFEELLAFHLRGQLARRRLERLLAPVIPFDEAATRAFVASLPFALTADQKRVAWRVLQDLGSGRPMQRLVEGDVGSGKTVVAAIAMHACALVGQRSLLMAPTEILAEQHHATVSKLLEGTPFKAALRTANRKDEEKGAAIVIGTHALLSKGYAPKHVALVVVDEQHRFGVAQRQELLSRLPSGEGETPHFLSMTATPIPRSLALALFGDVDFSALRDMPPGRKPVQTFLAGDRDRAAMIAHIRSEAAAGRKTFVVCPLIEASDKLGAKAAEEEVERLRREAFPDLEIGLLHGRMKADEKRAVMERFSRGDLPILVSTTVVEVGVDVRHATVMVVEGAERFGVAQLHQLRGRVGRSDLPSRCYLALSNDAPPARARLEAFVRARDCFELSELDLRFRGPGSLLGEEQSGFAELKRFRPNDVGLIEETKEAATALLEADPELVAHPGLRAGVMPAAAKVHLE